MFSSDEHSEGQDSCSTDETRTSIESVRLSMFEDSASMQISSDIRSQNKN